MKIMRSYVDVLNWVEEQTNDWPNREDHEVDRIIQCILSRDERPAWGRDWSEYLEQLPELELFL